MSERDEMQAGQQPIAHDNERFKLLASNGRPKLPGGCTGELSLKTTRALIGERLRENAAEKSA
jgi:hypothetical protein